VLTGITLTTPLETHCPIEPHASVAHWEGEHLTMYDATQGVFEVRRKLASVFGIGEDRIRVISPFVGGGFGNKGSVWWHQCLAALAAREVGRPVKLVLARDQMFANTGHRACTVQELTFGARRDGTITSLTHDIIADTSTYDVFVESSGEYSSMAYAFPNAFIRHRLVRMNIGTPTFMRAPGEATGSYALEVALDDLAVHLGVDPIQLRLRNYAETDPMKDKPFSSKHLRACYERGAARIGWERRNPAPRSMRDGRELIGLGMAGGAYPSQIFNASAIVTMKPDGSVVARSGTQEIGQGSYTALAQIVAGELGIDPGRVKFELGDTSFPRAMNSGGSTTIASVGSALTLACRKLKAQIGSEPLRNEVSATADYTTPKEREGYSCYSFCAQFAEVAVDPDFGTVRVRRMFGVFDVGRVVNARLSHSQCIGGMTMGIGMALLERTIVDPRTARIMNANLADYRVPVNADIGELDAELIAVPDTIANAAGTKPVGEIGICGAAAAVANAVFHATGRRPLELPIGLASGNVRH
jgi:xanthine dehydrogenase YagR molybdenum-binding subunit